MPVLITLGAILLFFAALLSLRVTFTLVYSDELQMSLRVLGIRFRRYPERQRKRPRRMSKKKAERIRLRAQKKAQKRREAALARQEEKRRRKEAARRRGRKKNMSEILDTLRLVHSIVSELSRRFFRHLRIDVARVHVKVATGDAAATAVAYGATCTAINMLLPVLADLKSFSLPSEKNFSVEPDFLGDTPTLDLKLSLSLRVWQILHIIIGGYLKYFAHKFKKAAPMPPNQGNRMVK